MSGSSVSQLYIVYMGEKHHEDPDVVTSLHHDTLSSLLGRFVHRKDPLLLFLDWIIRY